MKKLKKRMTYILTFVIILIIEILIGLFINDDFIRPYLGDMLIIILLYCFIRIFIPNKIKLLSLYVFIFASSIEVVQYLNLIDLLGIKNNILLTIMGSVFDLKDILCYGIGSIITGTIDLIIFKKD